MKINELMIGDWVLFNGNPKKVTSLFVTDLGVDQIYVFEKTCQVGTISEYVEPIPLTAEILEKNGFKKTTDEKYCMCDDYYELSAEEYSDSIWLICCADLECNLPVQKVMVSYVNQLQQFLRLCGLSDLADNFKIE